MSQQELANVADLPKITIQRIETAKYSVTLDILISISKALSIPMSQLLDFVPPDEPESEY